MTEVSYRWYGEDHKTDTTKSYPEVCEWVKNYGGTYKIEYKYVETYAVAYCMAGAASAIERWKNYKF